MQKKKKEKDKLVYVICMPKSMTVDVKSREVWCDGCSAALWASEATIDDAMRDLVAPGGEVRFICLSCATKIQKPIDAYVGEKTRAEAKGAIERIRLSRKQAHEN